MFKKPYNKALDNFRMIRRHEPGSPPYEKALFNTIRYAKEALAKNKNDGDAHILLANAYYLACLLDFPSDNFSRYLPLAAAVIYEWANRPMYSKEKAIGEHVYSGIVEQLNKEHPEWMGVSKPAGTIRELNQKYYQQAIV